MAAIPPSPPTRAGPLRAAPPSPPAAAGVRKRNWLLRTWRGRAVLAGMVLVGFLLVGWGLSRMTPRWHRPFDPKDLAVIDASDRAQKTLMDLQNAIQRVPLGEQRWKIEEDEVNSFLAIYAPPYVNPDGSNVPPLSEPVVMFTPGTITMSARLKEIPSGNPAGGVGSVVFSVGIVDDPQGHPMGLVKATGLWVGNLPVPASLIQTKLKQLAPEAAPKLCCAITQVVNPKNTKRSTELEQILTAAFNGEPFPLEWDLGRKFIIKEMRVDEGELSVVLTPATPAAVRPRP